MGKHKTMKWHSPSFTAIFLIFSQDWKAHKGGVRYPIPRFLQYQSKYPSTYDKLNEM